LITTTAAGRTWHFSHALGRRTTSAEGGFNAPVAIAAAPGGVLFVVSKGWDVPINAPGFTSRRICKLTIEEEFFGDFAHREFIWPAGIAISSEGNVYCSDEHLNAISWFSPDGPFCVEDSGRANTEPFAERLGHWGETGSREGALDGPSGIAFDSNDDLYVVDSRNNRVQKFAKDGRFILSWGAQGSGRGEFQRPWGITVDREGNVYVVDWGNDRVQKFSTEGDYLLSLPSAESSGAALNHPADVAVDSDGDVYVTDWGNMRVQIYDAEGDVLTALHGDATVFSRWGRRRVEADSPVMDAYRRIEDLTPLGRFRRPVGIVVDEQDRIIVTDSTRGRLQVYSKERDYPEVVLSI
jgi:DNA-binding beta-propeller fold protein YncE